MTNPFEDQDLTIEPQMITRTLIPNRKALKNLVAVRPNQQPNFAAAILTYMNSLSLDSEREEGRRLFVEEGLCRESARCRKCFSGGGCEGLYMSTTNQKLSTML